MHTSARAGSVRAADSTGPAWGKLALIALAVISLTAVWRYTPLRDFLTPERVLDWAQTFRHHWWAPLAVIAAYTPACFTMFPRPFDLRPCEVAHGVLRENAAGVIGRQRCEQDAAHCDHAVRGDRVRTRSWLCVCDEMSDVLRKRGLAAVFAVRIIPVAPFAIVGMVAGRIPIKLWHFVLGTSLGILPGTLTTWVFGDQIQTALEDPSRIHWGLVGGVIVVFVVLALIIKRWFADQRDK